MGGRGGLSSVSPGRAVLAVPQTFVSRAGLFREGGPWGPGLSWT